MFVNTSFISAFYCHRVNCGHGRRLPFTPPQPQVVCHVLPSQTVGHVLSSHPRLWVTCYLAIPDCGLRVEVPAGWGSCPDRYSWMLPRPPVILCRALGQQVRHLTVHRHLLSLHTSVLSDSSSCSALCCHCSLHISVLSDISSWSHLCCHCSLNTSGM